MMAHHRLQPVLLAMAAACSILSVSASAHGPKGHEDRAIAAADEQNALEAARPSDANTTVLGEVGADTGVKSTTPTETPGERIGAFLRALHPASVHFPIAFFLLAGVLEFASLRPPHAYRA